jgi:CBS-domain-containing membrane protein
MKADADAALRFYGETLDIRRPSLRRLGSRVPVRRVRLVYEGGKLMPGQTLLEETLRDARKVTQGVEVEVQ